MEGCKPTPRRLRAGSRGRDGHVGGPGAADRDDALLAADGRGPADSQRRGRGTHDRARKAEYRPCRPASVILNSDGKACWCCSTLSSSVTTIQPCSHSAPSQVAVAPSADAHSLIVLVALDGLAAGHLGAATRLFANPFSLADNVASLKFGTASATRIASTATAIISSTSVNPPCRASRPVANCCHAGH